MSFFGRPFTDAKKLVNKATNSKVAKAVPGGKSIGKSIRNAPGMKLPPKPAPAPATGGLAPSPQLQTQQMPAAMNPPPEPASAPMEPMNGAQAGLMNRIPGGDQTMQPIPEIGTGMSQPMVMPRTPTPQPTPQMNEGSGIGPQMDFAALANRAPVARRPMGRMRPMY